MSGDLFSDDDALERAHERAKQAGDHADRLEPDWVESAAELVREYAQLGTVFSSEDVGFQIPEGADPRAAGQVMLRAARLEYIERVGVKRDKWGSFKSTWRAKP